MRASKRHWQGGQMSVLAAPGRWMLTSLAVDAGSAIRGDAIDAYTSQGVARSMLDAAWVSVRSLDGREVAKFAAALEPLTRLGEGTLQQGLRGEIRLLVAISHIWRDDFSGALLLAEEIADRKESRGFNTVLLTVLRLCYLGTRDFSALYEMPRSRCWHANRISVLAHIVNLSVEAAAESEQLRFKMAERLAKDAIKLSNRLMGVKSSTSLLANCVLANLAYESGSVDEADLLVRNRLAAIEAHGWAESTLLGMTVCAHIETARGNSHAALTILREGERIGMLRDWPRVVARCAAEQVAIHLGEHDVELATHAFEGAEQWLARRPLGSAPIDRDAEALDMARYRLALATSQYAVAIKGFRRLRDASLNRHQLSRAVKLTTLMSAALYAADQREDAKKQLLDALQQGADAGLFRTFTDEMPLIEACLRDIRSSRAGSLGHLNSYVALLLSVAGPTERRKGLSNLGIRDLLSAKEADILRLMSLGLSNKSIARELHIAPETVKSHAKRIFIKLSTRTRTEAVARANELGLL